MRLSWKIYICLAGAILLTAVATTATVSYQYAQREQTPGHAQQVTLAKMAVIQLRHLDVWTAETLQPIFKNSPVRHWEIRDDAGQVVLDDLSEEVAIVVPEGVVRDTPSRVVEPTPLGTSNGLSQWTIPLSAGDQGTAWQLQLKFEDRGSAAGTTPWLATIPMIAVVTAVMLGVSLILARAAVRPLSTLTRTLKQLKAGQVTLQTIPQTNHEFGDLFRSLDEIAKSAQQREALFQNQTGEYRQTIEELLSRNKQLTAQLDDHQQELERKQVACQLADGRYEESQRRLHSFMEHVSEAVVILDPSTGQVLEANENAVSLFGYDRTWLMRLSWLDLVSDNQQEGTGLREACQPFVLRAAAGESLTLKWRMLDSQAVEIPAVLRLNRITWNGKGAVVASVTDRRQEEDAQEKLADLNQRFDKASRQASNAEIASSVLHNVGNVLNSVHTAATQVKRTAGDLDLDSLAQVAGILYEHRDDLETFVVEDRRGKLLPEFLHKWAKQLTRQRGAIVDEVDVLTRNIDHINQIIRTQQSYAKTNSAVVEVSVKELIEDALRISNPRMTPYQAQVTCEYGETKPVMTDKHRVLQILINLVNNAKHAVVCRDKGKRRIDIWAGVENQELTVRVTDNGLGISEDHLNRIFEYGFTTKDEGHGYGLHSCALSARDMGGALTASSDGLDTGATFTLQIPAKPGWSRKENAMSQAMTSDPAEQGGSTQHPQLSR